MECLVKEREGEKGRSEGGGEGISDEEGTLERAEEEWKKNIEDRRREM